MNLPARRSDPTGAFPARFTVAEAGAVVTCADMRTFRSAKAIVVGGADGAIVIR